MKPYHPTAVWLPMDVDDMPRIEHYGCMKTTIDIPDNELADAMRFLNATSKREAVVTALRELNRRHRMARLVRFSGTCDFPDNATIEAAEIAEIATSDE